MPEARLNRTRATLPSGYQFGDGRKVSFAAAWDAAGKDRWLLLEAPNRRRTGWRPMHENAAERLKHWNTIEPD